MVGARQCWRCFTQERTLLDTRWGYLCAVCNKQVKNVIDYVEYAERTIASMNQLEEFSTESNEIGATDTDIPEAP